MSIIIDRRLNPQGKNHINRQRYLERVKDNVKKTIEKTIAEKSIKEISGGDNVIVRSKDTKEPTFIYNNKTGKKRSVLPGNKKYDKDDKVKKPEDKAGAGGDRGEGGDDEDSSDDFEFSLTREEFINYLFDDLELPDFIKQSLKTTKAKEHQRAGFTTSGSPANLNLVRTFKNSIGRRHALARPTDQEIETLERDIEEAKEKNKKKLAIELQEQLDVLLRRRKSVPFLEENDLRYNLWQQNPKPMSQAVMFCMMDVSASMGEKEKDIAKRFFLILYLFLECKYEKIDIRFIRHTTTAEEVDEETFFYDGKTGGTTISTGLELIADIIQNEYKVDDWNIYIAQCTDGDNTSSDNKICEQIIIEDLQPIIQYFAYINIGAVANPGAYLGAPLGMFGDFYGAYPTYKRLSEIYKNIQCRIVTSKSDVFLVFRELFKKMESV